MGKHTELSATTEPAWLRWLLTALAIALILGVVVLPLAVVIVEASASGWQAYLTAVTEDDAIAAIRLTLLVAVLCVPANIVFGIAAAWAIDRFEDVGVHLWVSGNASLSMHQP